MYRDRERERGRERERERERYRSSEGSSLLHGQRLTISNLGSHTAF
jgi:hypothetical protein